ncbi:MAG: hypothetical protein PHQ50_05380 [Eubacteriales bacterium]|nr:hypothetical protein [Eubacteriales bacterium]
MSTIIEEVPGLYPIIKLDPLRKTPGVVFDTFPMDRITHIDAVDRVIHQNGALSPGSIGEVKRPWYMHFYQDDNLLVLNGSRSVDIYTKEHGKVEHFDITPNSIHKNGTLIYEGGAILVWPRYVFHRIVSGPEGSASINLAAHYEGFNIDTNFNIYDLNTETGEYEVIRKGRDDQKPL